MKNSEYYTFKLIHKTDDPYLKNVDLAIVLTMENSSRTFDDPVLLNLARYTYLQINKGYKNCNKPGVNNPAQDLQHAFKNAMKNTFEYDNVIIFEDDAKFNNKYSIDEFTNIDNFIKTERFDIYSFGCISVNIPTISDHKFIFSSLGASHAIIYSKPARNNLLYIDGNHIDTDIITKLTHKYKYKYPLICQTFPDTESKKDWGNNTENFIFTNFINILSGNKQIEPFWCSIYFLCDACVYMTFLIVLIIIFIIK